MRTFTIKKCLRFIRLLIGVAIAYVLIHMLIRSTGADVKAEIFKANRFLFTLSVLWFAGSILFLVERLYILLRIQDIHLSRWEVTKVSMSSYFLNIILPGAVSGDLIKMIYLFKKTEKKKAEALLTIFWDRVIGMVGLMVVASFIIALYLPHITSLESKYYYLQISVLTVGFGSFMGALIFFLLVFQSYRKDSFAGKLFERVLRKIPKKIASIVDRLTTALNLFRKNSKIIFKTLLLSIFNHFWLSANLFLIGYCVGEHIMQFGDYILATQFGNLIAVFPITPGGIGLRDASSALVFQAFGSQTAKAGTIPVIMTLIILFWRLVGGFFFMMTNFSESKVNEGIIVAEEKIMREN